MKQVDTVTISWIFPEIRKILFHHGHILRIGGGFQIFAQLSCFCIRLVLHFVDLSQKKVGSRFVLVFVELAAIRAFFSASGSRCSPK